jgi:hypothetical protein
MPKAKATPSKPAVTDREATKKKAPARSARAKKPAATAKAKKAPATVKRTATATKAARPRATPVKKPATKTVRAKKPAAAAVVVVKVKKSAATAKAPVGAEPAPKVTRGKAPERLTTETTEPAVSAAPEPVVAKPQAAKPAETRAASVKEVTRPTEVIARARESSVPAPKQQTERDNRRTSTRPQTFNVPLTAIDTSLAAQVAASMVANHLAPPRAADPLPPAASYRPATKMPPADSIPGRRETSTFRRMKERLANPPSHQLDSVLGVLPRKKTHPRVTGTGFVPGQSIDKNYGIGVRPVNPLRRKAG